MNGVIARWPSMPRKTFHPVGDKRPKGERLTDHLNTILEAEASLHHLDVAFGESSDDTDYSEAGEIIQSVREGLAQVLRDHQEHRARGATRCPMTCRGTPTSWTLA